MNTAFDREDYGPEDEHEYEETEPEHEGEDNGRVASDDGEYVGSLRGHPADEDLRVGPLERGGDVLAADGLHDVDGGVAPGLSGDDSRQQCQVSGVVDDRANNGLQTLVRLERRLELFYGLLRLGTVDSAVDHDIGGVEAGEGGEVLFHYEEGLPCLGAFGEDVDAVNPGLDLEVEDRGGDHGSADDDDADNRGSGDDAGYHPPRTHARRIRRG